MVETGARVGRSDTGNADWQRNLTVALDRIGEVRDLRSDSKGALLVYKESLEIRRKLAASDPGNAQWQRDLSVGLDQMGNTQRAAGDLDGALRSYDEGLAISRKLAAATSDARTQRDVGIALGRIGDVSRCAERIGRCVACLCRKSDDPAQAGGY